MRVEDGRQRRRRRLRSTGRRRACSVGREAETVGAQHLGAADLATVNGNATAKARVSTSQAGPIQYLAINTKRGDLQQLKVRQALEYAVDKKAYLVASGGSNAGTYASTLITPGIAGRQDYDLYPAPATGDVAKAKALLASAKVHGLKLTFAGGGWPTVTTARVPTDWTDWHSRS